MFRKKITFVRHESHILLEIALTDSLFGLLYNQLYFTGYTTAR